MRHDASIFRSEAILADEDNWLGAPSVAGAKQATFWTAIALVVVIGCAVLLGEGTYTRKIRMEGQIAYTSGPIVVSSPLRGTVSEPPKEEIIKKGDTLFVIAADTATQDGPMSARLVAERRAELQRISEIEQTKEALASSNITDLRARIMEKGAELSQVALQIQNLDDRLEWAKVAVEQQEILLAKGIGLESTRFDRKREYYAVRGEVDIARRTKEQLNAEVLQLKRALVSEPAKLNSEIAVLKREATRVQQQIIEAAGRTTIIVTSPVDGKIVPPVAKRGQLVDVNEPLASILPADGELAVDLFASTEAVGLLSVGASVLLRFDAFPYRRYGQFPGKVSAISEAPLPSRTNGSGRPNDVFYWVRVQLPSWEIEHAGKRLKLLPGMKIQAHALVETRPIYQWLALPLFERVKHQRSSARERLIN